LVEWPSPAQRRLFPTSVNVDAVIPLEVHHIVLVRCFYSRAHVEYRDERLSQHRETPPSMEFNVVEIVLLVEGAGRYEGLGSSCFMFATTVRDWISKNYKKTGSKYVLNSIQKAALNNIENTY
jgi:hypothetical protein